MYTLRCFSGEEGGHKFFFINIFLAAISHNSMQTRLTLYRSRMNVKTCKITSQTIEQGDTMFNNVSLFIPNTATHQMVNWFVNKALEGNDTQHIFLKVCKKMSLCQKKYLKKNGIFHTKVYTLHILLSCVQICRLFIILIEICLQLTDN